MIARHVPYEIRADEPASAVTKTIARLNPAAVPRQTTPLQLTLADYSSYAILDA